MDIDCEEYYDDDEGVYSDGDNEDGYFNDGDDDGDDDNGVYSDGDGDSVEAVASRSKQNYTVLSEDDIRQREEEAIMEVFTVLSISRVSALVLLLHYNWSVSNVTESWFADQEKVCRTVGLMAEPVVCFVKSKKLMCRICFENFLCSKMFSASCGHLFCGKCWNGYISTAIKDGPGCLMLRCPEPKCVAAVDREMVDALVSEEEDKEKYSRYLLRSYVEASKTSKWCPAPGCDFAVKFELGNGNYDVSCKCAHSFCWNCIEDAHRPVDCETVGKWIVKNSAESENTNWILANSKPCPKCKRPIEKNHGCMHMTCTPPCKFEFCWLCLGTWSEHGERTGGFYACNSYEKAKKDGTFSEDEKIREMAKSIIEKYTHYYERWAGNQKSRLKAMEDLQQLQTVHMEKLCSLQMTSETQLQFLPDAWQQIIECRRVLKWTYALGYYLPEEEHAKKQFFEYLQGEAESWLERLHQCAEKDLQVFLTDKGTSEDFKAFHSKLVDLTVLTRKYFQNLVRALENGLADVDSR